MTHRYKQKIRTCKICGCTDYDCSICIKKTGERCSWVAKNLCSACKSQEELLELKGKFIIKSKNYNRFTGKILEDGSEWVSGLYQARLSRSLAELMSEIRGLFEAHETRYSTHMFSLVCWQSGNWSICVTDDWHKWSKKGLLDELQKYHYATPEDACEAFLKYVKDNKIKIKKLQSR